MRRSMLAGVSFVASVVLLASAAVSSAQTPPLTGTVKAEQGALEGVLVSAKKDGSNITVTVVSDKDGRYSFPAGRLEPGQYGLRIRAVGFDLDNARPIAITAGKTTTADLTLRKTEDLAAQLSNAEWMASIPGTDQQKAQLLNCVGCHSLSRPLNSNHSADDFMTITLPRMQGYVNQSIPQHPQLRKAERLMEERGDQRVKIYRAAAEYLASINLSKQPRWSFDLKTQPLPSGAATRVIYTEYDLPRDTIEPHDVIIDKEGIAWYSNFGEQNLGRLDPKTGKVTEFQIQEHKPDFPTGSLGLRSDRDGNLWLGNMYQATMVKFDRKKETFQYFPLQGEQNIDAAQINMVSPESA
ncbi:MAG TPA: carboxypeptidase regulatory-like domain-containing protein, partial [Pseudolabrys sp.]